MKKNDKLIALIGVIILVIASIGVYYWVPEETKVSIATIDDFFAISGKMSDVPDAVAVSDSSPFYALIATPLTIHYSADGEQHVRPLYVKNLDELSQAVARVESQIGIQANEIIDGSKSAKDVSLEIAKKYWKSSDAVLLIEYNESGYNLGVVAAPIASYLSIPIIVADEINQDVREVLVDLGVEYSLICGDLEGYGKQFKFDDVDEIVDTSIEIVMEKFGEVEYVTLTNPRDAWPPEVLRDETVLYEDGTLMGGSMFPSGIKNMLLSLLKPASFSFTIPEDYKYALVKLHVKNLEDPEHVELFGDDLVIGGSLTNYMRTVAYPAERDEHGNVEYDQLYYETVLYDMGGEEFSIKLTSSFHVLDSAEFEISVTVEELSNPYYPMMKQFSSIAPYLTAYHKGIIFAKPEFAFVPDDDVELDGTKLSGNTQPFFNPMLIPVVNQHVYENIHLPLNNLLAKITDIDITDSVESLKKECYHDPFYIALVGDAVMLPQYYYRSPHSDPFINSHSGAYGTNCPSDFLYGNIDPETYSLLPYAEEHLENDLHSDFPEAENIVGRITGWDVQDASALIVRTIFYDKVIEELGEWKDNAVVLTGAGADMQKLPVFTFIREILGTTEPMKFPTGEKRFLVKRVTHTFEEGGFNAQKAERGRAQREGYSAEALWEIKTDGILNLLFFPMMLVKMRQGFENIESLFSPKWWIETALSDGSGVRGGELEESSNLILSDSHAIWFEKEHGDILMYSLGGPRIIYQLFSRYIPLIPLRTPLAQKGSYSVRDVAEMDMGPSVMMVEGCGSGKIDGPMPINTLANAYLHAGVNAYISPTTLSAFYGALEPRFGKGVGFGILGYIKAASDLRKGKYIPVYFNQFIFEEAMLDMFENDVDIGTALRNAKNAYLPAQFDIPFRWTPPLSISSDLPAELGDSIMANMKTTAAGGNTFPVEKYCTIYQVNLLGDPAFNPYEPVNEGSK